MEGVIYLVIFGTAVWVAIDASQYRSRYGPPVKGPSIAFGPPKPGDTGGSPVLWFFGCILIWIVAFPMYLVKRSQPPAELLTKAGSVQQSQPWFENGAWWIRDVNGKLWWRRLETEPWKEFVPPAGSS